MKKIAIIAESKEKLVTNEPIEAIRLYNSVFFRKILKYIQARSNIGKKNIYIISKHGLLHSSKKLLPYETMSSDLNKAWANNVFNQIKTRFPNKDVTIEFHAGKGYLKYLLPMLEQDGYSFYKAVPEEYSLGLGSQLKWYNSQLTGNVVTLALSVFKEPKGMIKACVSLTRELVSLGTKDVSLENIEKLYKSLMIISSKKGIGEILALDLKKIREFIKKQNSLNKQANTLKEKLHGRLMNDKGTLDIYTKYKDLSEKSFQGENTFEEFMDVYAEFKQKARPILKMHESIGEIEGYILENEREITSILNNLSKKLLKVA